MSAAENDPSLSPLRQSFRSRAVERGYQSRHADDFFAALPFATHSLGQALLYFVLLGTAWGAPPAGDTRARNVFTWCCAGAVLLSLALCAARAAYFVRSPKVASMLQEALAIACGAVFATSTLVMWLTRERSSAAASTDMGPATGAGVFKVDVRCMLPIAGTIVASTSFMYLSCVTWPRSAIGTALPLALELCALIVACATGGANSFWYPALLFGILCAVLLPLASLVSWGRRRAFIEMVAAECDRRQAAVARKATDALIMALFPAEVALELVAARVRNMRQSSAAGTAVLDSFGSPLSMINEASSPLVAKTYTSATVIVVALHGLGRVSATGEQLEMISRVFLATEGIASSEMRQHQSVRSACEFSIALQRLICILREDLANENLNFAAGIATGPIIAGVIGMARPRYDAWGYTVSVAKQLSEIATPGQVLVTKDVVKPLRSTFCFKVMKDFTVVRGIGRIVLFRLSYPSESFPVDIRVAERPSLAVFSRAAVKLSEIAQLDLPLVKEPSVPVLQCYRNFQKETQFLSYYINLHNTHYRWGSIAISLASSCFFAWSIADTGNSALTIGFSSALVFSLWILFVSSFLPLRPRPVVFEAVVSVLTVIPTLLISLAMLLLAYDDSIMSLNIGWHTVLYMSILPHYLAFPQSVTLQLSSLRLCITGRMGWESFVLPTVSAAVLGMYQYLNEMRLRRWFLRVAVSYENKYENEMQRAVGEQFLATIIPLQFLQRIQGQSNDTTYISEYIPSCTIMVCEVVDFEGRLARSPSLDVVRLLNSLYTCFDSLTQQQELSPLKTIAGKYIVVGNMLNNAEEHALLVTELAASILRDLPRWNRAENAESPPIFVRIGIHSDSEIMGIIKTRSCIFDFWGDAIMIADRICYEAPPGTALLSESTTNLYMCETQHYKSMSVHGQEIETYVLGVELPQQQPEPSRNDFSFMPSVDGIDYGVIPQGEDLLPSLQLPDMPPMPNIPVMPEDLSVAPLMPGMGGSGPVDLFADALYLDGRFNWPGYANALNPSGNVPVETSVEPRVVPQDDDLPGPPASKDPATSAQSPEYQTASCAVSFAAPYTETENLFL
eukprot:m51a1_g2983 putative adenylate guanylate cyclase (1076) ;mRNA; f:726408-730377